MRTEELITFCRPIARTGPMPARLGDLHHDSRKIQPGDLFIAIRGQSVNGHDYIDQALNRGACVILTETPLKQQAADALILQVTSTRDLIGPLSQALQGDPSRQMTMIGVTGTNGKTTVATLTWQLLTQLGETVGLLGTVHKQIGKQQLDSTLTTADPVELAADMRLMTEAGCSHLAMEVSSHALDQQRTDGISWNIAAYTNLSHDHLDYHGSIEMYIAAKRRLFESLSPEAAAIVNADDPHAEEIVRGCRAQVTRFSFREGTGIPCKLLHSGPEGLTIRVDNTEIRSPLAGRFNAYNVAETWLICRSLGFDEQRLTDGLGRCHGAPGRLEKVTDASEIGLKPTVFVDYAHTPDALANVVSTLRDLKEDRQPLIVVFGCGGDRDRAKRPVMAEVAETWSDRIVVTSDNPRSEDPLGIVREIEQGFSSAANWESIPSRSDAIERAVQSAPANAIVLIAGKGHETYQEVDGHRYTFDDRKEARRALKNYRTEIRRGGEA